MIFAQFPQAYYMADSRFTSRRLRGNDVGLRARDVYVIFLLASGNKTHAIGNRAMGHLTLPVLQNDAGDVIVL